MTQPGRIRQNLTSIRRTSVGETAPSKESAVASEDAASDPSVSVTHSTRTTTPLCDVCQSMFKGELLSPDNTGILRYPTRGHPNLRQAELAASSCYICREVTKQAETDTHDAVDLVECDHPLNYSIFQGSRELDNGWKSLIISIGNVSPKVMSQFELVPAKDIDCYMDLDGNTGSSVTLANVTALVDNCVKTHRDCREISPTWHPSRLLEIQCSNSNNDDTTVRVVELSSVPKVRYAALSHCWGGVVPVMLTKNSAASLYRGLGIKELPRTFGDAVCVASSLDLQYLWVDSLCIVQDDEEDWQKDAILMNEVYQCAHVTIAATAGANSGHGLFQTERPLSCDPQWLLLSGTDLRRS